VRILGDEIISAAGAFENDMGHSPESTEAAEGHHPALISDMPGLNLIIGPANITAKQRSSH
jgi:hypothetical protein